jgi:hypothetical protein
LALGAIAASSLAAFPAAAAFAPWTFAVVVALSAFTTIAFTEFTFLREGFPRHHAEAGSGCHEFECESFHGLCLKLVDPR